MRASTCVERVGPEWPCLDQSQVRAQVGCDAVGFRRWDNKGVDAEPATPSREGTEVLWIQANAEGALITPSIVGGWCLASGLPLTRRER